MSLETQFSVNCVSLSFPTRCNIFLGINPFHNVSYLQYTGHYINKVNNMFMDESYDEQLRTVPPNMTDLSKKYRLNLYKKGIPYLTRFGKKRKCTCI